MMDFLWKNFFNKEEKNKQEILRNNPLFSSLNKKEMAVLSQMIYTRSFVAGEFIFQPGRGIGMYIIVSGHVHILYGKSGGVDTLIMSRLKDGDFFGETALVREQGHPFVSAQAAEECTLLGFFKPSLLTIIEKNPSTGAKILMKLGEILEKRLRKAGEKLSELNYKAEN